MALSPAGHGGGEGGPSPVTLNVWGSGDRYAARRAAREWVAQLGFSESHAGEVEIVVSELASNLVKHARGGVLRLEALTGEGRTGMQLESIDTGPGIRDVDRAMGDGYTTAGSLGYGLGTVHRLMDEVEVYSGPQGGTHIRCIRWLRRPAARVGRCPLGFGVITRPHPSSEDNGDAFVIKSWDHYALVGVIDGLGHGQFALRAAQTARNYIERHYDQPLERIFQETHRACRGTRGVVMALARFDCARETFSFASVGNIEARLLGSSEKPSFIVPRGVVGLNAPPPRVTGGPWEPEAMLVMHSDGLSTRWSPDDFPGITTASASDAAQQLFRRLGKPNDDATVVVVKGRAGDR